MQAAFHVGLTGGIGSGKSTVAALLAGHGAAVIDADAIARQLTAPGGAAMAAIGQRFGADFITAEGALNRDRMRDLAFTQPAARQQLEAIIHPLVTEETWRQAQVAQAAGHPCLVFDVPLLVESATWRQKVDHVLVVDCLADTQIARVMARNAMPRAAVEAIMANQSSRLRRLKAADSVIFNEGMTLEDLRLAVAALAPRFKLSLRFTT
ncbi:MAG: dephospho-CoA kinase [Comamonadaceae bacterium CG_4_9_14_3_um_filter_60_33]|nr:MAG: dephospho-CoA kinase [Comamonadaceae bacterium CG2_30_59_20]PIY28764.1 MAG: dephospho-CoA kinase [Comamonadaceae bacterium CG_4_10_14_3_um_filter_60_42]PJB42659.1 MAG: dephospho-CoA kinase [Comamonadaceae bacterium CG_4_9_14_3_um_filter_60_33]